MIWTENWRCCKQHNIYPRVNYFLISIEAYKAICERHFLSFLLFNSFSTGIKTILKHITQRYNLKVWTGTEKLNSSTCSSSSTSNKPGFKNRAIGCLVEHSWNCNNLFCFTGTAGDQRRNDNSCYPGSCCFAQKITPRNTGFFHFYLFYVFNLLVLRLC